MEEKSTVKSTGRFKRVLSNNTSVLILLVILIVFAFVAPALFGKANISQIILESSIYGMLAVGLSLVMMAGSIDLSIGYLMALSAVVSTSVYNATGNIPLAFLLGLICGALLGLINGTLITKIGINPLIATIAMSYIYSGIVNYCTNGGSMRAAELTLNAFYKAKLFGLSFLNTTVIIFVILLILIGLVLRRTNIGNNLYITGGNAEAGTLAGINTNRMLLLAYIACGVCCAIAGLFLSARFSGASYTLGSGKEVFAISACVIGGIKMSGGKGTMTNVLIGILIMRVITTALNVLCVPSAWTDFVSGMLLLVIIVADRISKRKEEA